MNCPKCSSSAGIKSGKIKGKQRYKCKNGRQRRLYIHTNQ